MLLAIGSCVIFIFFFKQKTAYEMLISDWSSDVCSSDLIDIDAGPEPGNCPREAVRSHRQDRLRFADIVGRQIEQNPFGVRRQRFKRSQGLRDRKSVGEGKSVSGSVDPGCIRFLKIKNRDS